MPILRSFPNACPRCLLHGAATVWLTALFLAFSPMPVAAETVADAHNAIVQNYRDELAQLAEWCEAEKQDELANRTRNWLPPVRPVTLFVPLIAQGFEAQKKPEEASEAGEETEAARQWRERFDRLRREQAQRLFALLDRAIEEKEFAFGFGLLHETLREDPDHQAARKLLGYKYHEGRWLTQFELVKAKGNQVWDPRFGWQLKNRLPRYERGERLYKGRWITAEENARMQIDVTQGFDIMTEHYRVRTNHNLEDGVQLAARLERLYDAWRQVFVRYNLNDLELGTLLRGGGWPRRTPVRHQVVYFRNRKQYNAVLKLRQPYIEITTGYYEGKTKTAYFFASEEQDWENLYHEATHQLFSEARRTSSHIGQDANFWIIEGIACLMESVAESGTYCTIGGADAIRLKNARVRLLRDDMYVPLAELTAMGMKDVQSDKHIQQLYSEFSGLTYFLMFDQEGRYRDDLVDYLSAIYAGQDEPATLSELTKTSFGDLDLQYRRFIAGIKYEDQETDDEQLSHSDPSPAASR